MTTKFQPTCLCKNPANGCDFRRSPTSCTVNAADGKQIRGYTVGYAKGGKTRALDHLGSVTNLAATCDAECTEQKSPIDFCAGMADGWYCDPISPVAMRLCQAQRKANGFQCPPIGAKARFCKPQPAYTLSGSATKYYANCE